MIVVDTNVFVIDLRYPRDARYTQNRRFLEELASRGIGATTVLNLMELAGVLSFNLNPTQLRDLLHHFARRYQVAVLPWDGRETELPRVSVALLLARFSRGMAFGDALIIEAAERHAPASSCFVTWDARHFEGKTAFPVRTPEQALAEWDRD